jgi:hypothetical protein
MDRLDSTQTPLRDQARLRTEVPFDCIRALEREAAPTTVEGAVRAGRFAGAAGYGAAEVAR